MDVSKIVSALPQAKPTTPDEFPKRRSARPDGLIGLVNTGNSCYMNASLQALSNCPPFRQYMLECVHGHPPTQASGALSILFKKMWSSERNSGHLSARPVSAAMKNRIFHSIQQQDAQEFLRSLLNQIHDELSLLIPAYHLNYLSHHQLSSGLENRLEEGKKPASRASTNSRDSRSSSGSNCSLSQLVVQPNLNSSLSQEPGSTSSLTRPFRSLSLPNSPALKPKITAKGLYTQLSEGLINSEKKGSSLSVESRLKYLEEEEKTDEECISDGEEGTPVLPWSEDDSLAVDIISLNVTKHLRGVHYDMTEEDSRLSAGARVHSSAAHRTELHQGCSSHSSVITEVFEGLLESRVKCSECKKVSVTKETFQDLSLPIPGRKELMKAHKDGETEDHTAKVPASDRNTSFSNKMCRVWKTLVDMTRDLVSGPPTSLEDCLQAFFDTSNLNGDNRYYCQHCKNFQNSTKDMSIIRLPEVLCIHLKRFRFDAFFASKISRQIDFPLSDLDLSPYMKKGLVSDSDGCHHYELLSVVTHYGGAGGGHYIAYGRNTAVNRWYEFNDTHISEVSSEYIQSVEAYVLFYKKVSTESSCPLSISNIVPRSGTTVNSPELRYISRHWLMLRNTCSQPGPILQYDYACEHGGVLPGMQELAKYIAIPIRTEVWEELVEKYGGGPVVERLDVCEQCQSRLKQLVARRKQEKENIHQIQHNELKQKSETHLLSRHWLKQWQDFIRCESLDLGPPGPIDNNHLLCSGPDGKITLSPGSTYRRVSESVWNFFHKLYGGGPLLVTSPKCLPGDVP